MKHLTDHPEACPCGPELALGERGLVVVHNATIIERLRRRLAKLPHVGKSAGRR